MRLLLVGVFALGAVGALAGLFFGLLQTLHPAMDSFSHFRVHFAAVLVLCALFLLLLARGWRRWVMLLPALAAGFWVWVQASAGPPADARRSDLRVVQFNMNYGNPVAGRVAARLSALDADVVAVQEVTRAHEAALRGISHYPHQAHCAFRAYVGGVSILSKHPLSEVVCRNGEGLVTARVAAPGGAVTVASLHTYWPWPYSQHAQISEWRPALQALAGPVIVMGDFNAAPWSHATRRIEAASRTRVVPGLRMTIEVMGVPIPIDHVLLSRELCGLAARVDGPLGSDHFPVVVEIGREDRSATTACDRVRAG